MKALLWKDFRINLPIVIAAVFMCSFPYATTGVIAIAESWPAVPGASRWGAAFWQAGNVNLYLEQLVIALLGANAMACERADRSAEFLFSLPPSRLKILFSKFGVALAIALVLWCNVLVADVIAGKLMGNMSDGGRLQLVVGASGVFLFGVAWLGSSLWSSTAYALGAAVGVFVVVMAGLSSALDYAGWRPLVAVEYWYAAFCATVGIATFAAGTCYYLRRVEP